MDKMFEPIPRKKRQMGTYLGDAHKVRTGKRRHLKMKGKWGVKGQVYDNWPVWEAKCTPNTAKYSTTRDCDTRA